MSWCCGDATVVPVYLVEVDRLVETALAFKGE
jgi:hypothetical protein